MEKVKNSIEKKIRNLSTKRVNEAVLAFSFAVWILVFPWASAQNSSQSSSLDDQIQSFFVQNRYGIVEALKQKHTEFSKEQKQKLQESEDKILGKFSTYLKSENANTFYACILSEENKQNFQSIKHELDLFLSLRYGEEYSHFILDGKEYLGNKLEVTFLEVDWKYIISDIFITGNYYKSEK